MEISKRMLKFIVVITAILLPVKLLSTFGLVFLLPRTWLKEAASIGIIGGADGPTAIYMTNAAGPSAGWLFLLFFSLDIILCAFILVKAVKALRK